MSMFAVAAALAAQTSVAAAPPQIVVEGFGSTKTAPTNGTLSYTVQGEGKDSNDAVAALVAKTARVEAGLRSIDNELVLTSESVRVQAVRSANCTEDDSEYDPKPVLSTGNCAIAGYVARQDFTARTKRVPNVGTMVGVAGRGGALNSKIVGFGVDDSKAARDAAIASALADARTKAGVIAQASGASLGRVLNVSLDGARADLIVVTGSRRVPPPAPERDREIEVAISPEPVVTTASVTVSYSIN